ncbi:class I SAM-dependent methyltransferase [Nocardia sp. IBHARD005]|uniref:class I SAM-dependent methyltransferase n=1 Tax=Nocardia sp. IBHARD005 TaxID=3457765 RepID=UPI004057E57E
MRAATIEALVCPYTGGPLTLAEGAVGDGDRVEFGLVRSESFDFPIVGGVLLLGLGKGYGGHEEGLAPYVPIQAAAIEYLRRGDVEGLLHWLRRHSPLVHRLVIGGYRDYAEFAVDLHTRGLRLESAALAADADYGVLGDLGVRRRLDRVLSRPLAARAHRRLAAVRAAVATARTKRDPESMLAHSFYAQRFYSPRAAATALQLAHLPVGDRVLSLCGGHGVFENILDHSDRLPAQLICVDGQLVNLLAVTRFVTSDVDPICLDAQFTLPFPDGWFDAVFSSTCLPEIPAQAHFLREAIRVTGAHGWTLFDSLWALDSGVLRCDPYRPYRYLQNFLPRTSDYRAVLDRCVGERAVGYAVSGPPAGQLAGPRWAFGDAAITAELADPADTELNVLVVDRDRFTGFVPADHGWMPHRLVPSPAYHRAPVQAGPQVLHLRAEFADPTSVFASLDFPGLPARVELDPAGPPTRWTELFAAGALAALPRRYQAHRADPFSTV